MVRIKPEFGIDQKVWVVCKDHNNVAYVTNTVISKLRYYKSGIGYECFGLVIMEDDVFATQEEALVSL